MFARDIADAVFPASDPLVSLILSFATFAVGYLARPIGGIVLSHYGDRYGRRAVFLWSVFIMSGATLGMGLVPDYAKMGVAASLLMVTLRLIQGFCLGGELPGALTYVVETAPRIAPFVCGVVFACVTMGVAVATGVSLSVRTYMDPALVPAYGWRIAFVLGGLGGVLSFVLRRSLEESPEFARMRSLAVAAALHRAAADQPGSRADRLRAARRHRLLQRPVLLAPAGYLSGVLQVRPAAGGAGADGRRDRVGDRHPGHRLDRRSHSAALLAARRRRVAAGVFAVRSTRALESRAMNLTLLCVLAGLSAGLTNGSFAVLLTDLFPTRIRFTGVALVFNVSFTIFSGTAPLVATTLIRDTGSVTSPAYMMMASAALALVGSLWVESLRRQRASAARIPIETLGIASAVPRRDRMPTCMSRG